ncbi:hypothetical protein KSB_11480 [Ktedonobacter robiniae]|uniref:OmpR/PhoB-type domain-containing protein n=2 Tax=Ktedonobacter robiniae TaxID=2778365 RepID=A0ABQ3UJ02_9CHLR|nr:hypothetical protein KSB_11480 [Ktedonobacter robiniae]
MLMSDVHSWRTLFNPFSSGDMPGTGRVSGRSTDIRNLIANQQSAIILSGSPRVGKTAFVRYLKGVSSVAWSWRDEVSLHDLREQFALDQLYFTQIDLTTLENAQTAQELLSAFVTECKRSLDTPYAAAKLPSLSHDIKGLRSLLRYYTREFPEARYFVMLDAVERLARLDMAIPELEGSLAQTPQERGIALLNHCGAIRVLVDLIDEFTNFGVIFSIQSLARPKLVDQFVHVSADLARFTTIVLQCLTHTDAQAFLGQSPEDFGEAWAQAFYRLGGQEIFTPGEQQWLYEQAGSHPYILLQYCYHTFHFKQLYATQSQQWLELPIEGRQQLSEQVNSAVTTFLTLHWKRLLEAIEKGNSETKAHFFEFVRVFEAHNADEEIAPELWNNLGAELRYILSNEGVIRYEPFQPVYYPGAILCQYLLEKARMQTPPSSRGFWLTITRPSKAPERLSLSELEYHLIKTLRQHPVRCSEEELMQGAWGKLIERSTFTQRMHHLRKKLKDHSDNVELISNHYGGLYSLNHADWLHLE